MKIYKTDCLIIGTGMAGCSAALRLATQGVNITMVSRADEPNETATAWAQGGIVYKGDGDSAEMLIQDIEKAGAGICNRDAVKILAEEGPPHVKEILMDDLGLAFDMTPKGLPDYTNEAAHSLPRVLHVGDHTGRDIQIGFLTRLVTHERVQILSRHTAVDLLTLSHHSEDPKDVYKEPRCVGAYLFDQAQEEVIAVVAKETLLATGGLGQLYLHSTNPTGARGDGLAMAYRTGARIMNLEYVQFHPTTLYSKGSERFLITEAMRGEGAKLVNEKGEEFMMKHDARGALAPRDVVSRAIAMEMLGSEADAVYLDITHRPADWIRQRFPRIYQQCLERKIDITTQPIPVVPAAHYTCGGVAIDNNGRTTIRNMWAAGEVACSGLHGANRLASTSLLEGLVWGTRAGEAILRDLATNKYDFPHIRPWRTGSEPVDMALLAQDWLTIRHTMWNYVGLIRTEKRLARAHRILDGLGDEVERFYAHSGLSDILIGLRHASLAARLIMTAARRNRESIGAHYVADSEPVPSSDTQ